MKTLHFFGASLQELAALHNEWVRRRAAFELRQMQMGLPNSFTQMPALMSVAGVQAYALLARRRVVCVAEGADAVYVLHAFQKAGQKLHRREMTLALDRYRQTATPAATATAFHTSSGNVFFDFGYPEDQAAVMALRADLMGRLRLLARRQGWDQAQTTARLGIAPTSARDLIYGLWDRFSLDKLVRLATRAQEAGYGRLHVPGKAKPTEIRKRARMAG
jgi:phage-related protein/predicted XRE-type DNA-binding protein